MCVVYIPIFLSNSQVFSPDEPATLAQSNALQKEMYTDKCTARLMQGKKDGPGRIVNCDDYKN